MKLVQRLAQGIQLGSWRLREYLEFDSVVFQKLVSLTASTAALTLLLCKRYAKAFSLLARLHRSAFSPAATRLTERLISPREPSSVIRSPSWLANIYQAHIDRSIHAPSVAKFVKDPRRLFESMAIVLKSPGPQERGVLVLGYSYIFPAFLKLFDVAKIATRYFLVLEPSWSGYCDLDILCYSQASFLTFVQSPEPRDAQLLLDTTTNLIPVPTAPNWWIDHRVFRPLPDVPKDADVVIVAGWGRYKRHFRFFSALAKLRKQGHRMKAILVGYQLGTTQETIRKQATYYGVLDCLEFHEGLSPELVNRQLNRAKVNLLWSRREGVNRAVTEGMLAGLPCIQREGFNYGYHHSHINPRTGMYCKEEDLPRALLDMVQNHDRFTPREWVMQEMSCQKGAEVLGEHIGQAALKLGERWSAPLVPKVSALSGMRYWDPADRHRFEKDYAFLQSTLRATK